MERSILGQLLLVGVPGIELDGATADTFKRVQPGGFILFGRNIQSARQLRKLIDDLRNLSEVEPIITIDQEGGRVSRLKLIGNEPPNAQQLRDRGDLQAMSDHGRVTGELLRLFGFNLDLAPVLDVSFDDEADNSLRGRCYGKTVRQVVEFAGAFNEALLKTGIRTCGKHFPGYAAASLDPHHELPRIDRSHAELEGTELAIFRQFAHRVSSLMICHAWYPAFDVEKTPASLSRTIVTDLLIKDLGFKGLIMTDDLDMGAIINEVGFQEMIERAIRAGNHLAMICHRVPMAEAAFNVLRQMEASLLDPALEAVDQFKKTMIPADPFSEERFCDLNQQVWDLRVATLGPEKAALRSPDDGKRSPVEVY
jgi:beta-N-acetylhexosaminidase